MRTNYVLVLTCRHHVQDSDSENRHSKYESLSNGGWAQPLSCMPVLHEIPSILVLVLCIPGNSGRFVMAMAYLQAPWATPAEI